MRALEQLLHHGQSFWLDDLTRNMVRGGELARRVREEGLRGVTSNPKTFADAIEHSDAYDEDIVRLAQQGLDARAILDRLTVQDVQEACDVLRPIYDKSDGADGYVSLEVSPHLARQSGASFTEARRLFAAVDRPNAYIKIPGTPEGLPAIEDALADGINVNITLLFSVAGYLDVARAYEQALHRRLERGLPVDRVSSVASFFLSRIDVLVDERLDALPEDRRTKGAALKGTVAVANAKLAYQGFRETLAEARWQELAERGARVQRVLWASTGTKNPDDRDVKYIEPLIGPDTVSTMPYKTAQAFDDHGAVGTTVENGVDAARRTMTELGSLGIDFEDVTDTLLEDGIAKFVAPYDALLEVIDRRRAPAAGRARAGKR